MPRFEIALGLGSLEQDLLAMGQSGPLVLSRALNRAGVSGKTAMARAISADTGIRYKTVEKEIRLFNATRLNPKVVLEIRGLRLPLLDFKARGPEPSRGKGKGVSWTNQGAKKREPHAFIATVFGGAHQGPGSAHRGVFKRANPTTHRSGKPDARSFNLPIRELFGPSLPHVFEKFLPTFQAAAQESLVKNIVSQISFERSKQTGAE